MSEQPRVGDEVAVRCTLDEWIATSQPEKELCWYDGNTDISVNRKDVAPWRSAEWIAAAERLCEAALRFKQQGSTHIHVYLGETEDTQLGGPCEFCAALAGFEEAE